MSMAPLSTILTEAHITRDYSKEGCGLSRRAEPCRGGNGLLYGKSCAVRLSIGFRAWVMLARALDLHICKHIHRFFAYKY